MILSDLHVHTVFSDGKSTPREVVEEAAKKGMKKIGFSDHSYTDFDESFCIPARKITQYRECIADLKNEYVGKMEILCGIEQDYYSNEPTDAYDYVIGSVHYIYKDGKYIPVDESPQMLIGAVKKHFNGDIYAFAEEYYRIVSDVVRKTHADIIGHFDLVTKFNEGGKLFDESHPRYKAAALSAADILLESGAVFEINTGAISRGYRTSPYPSDEIIRYIAARSGKFILSSDSHSKETLCFEFENVLNKYASVINLLK